MDIASSLGKLQDPRAIPLLISIIEKPLKYQQNDGDSLVDNIFTSMALSRLVQQSCLKLVCFFNVDERVEQFLVQGIQNEHIQEACLAVLYISTQEDQYYEQLEQILNNGNTFNYSTIVYLNKHEEKSNEKIEKLLVLNTKILDEKKSNKNKKIK